MDESVLEKLKILACSAKYDISCSSSGEKRKNHNKGTGNAEGMGTCHNVMEDGKSLACSARLVKPMNKSKNEGVLKF